MSESRQIRKLSEEEGKAQYRQKLEEHLGYTGKIDYDFMGRNFESLGSIVGKHDCCSSTQGIKYYLHSIEDSKALIAKRSGLENEIDGLIDEYSKKKDAAAEAFSAAWADCMHELPKRSDMTLDYAFTAKAGLGASIESFDKSVHSYEEGLMRIVHVISEKYKILEKAYKEPASFKKSKEKVSTLASDLLKVMGIVEPEQTGIMPAVKVGCYDLLNRAIELAEWLIFKYPQANLHHNHPCQVSVDIPEFLVREEGLVKEGEAARGWHIYFECDHFPTYDLD